MNIGDAIIPTTLSIALGFGLTACGNDSKKTARSAQSMAKGSKAAEPSKANDYGLDGLSDAQSSHLREFLGSFEKEVGWPARPRRSVTVKDTIENSTVFSLGLNMGILGASLGSTIKPKFSIDIETNIMLIRTSKGGTEPLLKDSGGLNYDPNVDFVFVCSFTARATTGMAWENKVGLFGQSATNTTDVNRSIESNQTAQFVKIREGETLVQLKERCKNLFENEVKASVVNELKTLIKSNVGVHMDTKDTPIQIAAQAALEGPKKENIVYRGLTFNIYKAEAKKIGNDHFRITGKIIRHKKIAEVIPTSGETINYDITFKKGSIVNNTSDDNPKNEIDNELGKKLAEDVYLNKRDEFKE